MPPMDAVNHACITIGKMVQVYGGRSRIKDLQQISPDIASFKQSGLTKEILLLHMLSQTQAVRPKGTSAQPLPWK